MMQGQQLFEVCHKIIIKKTTTKCSVSISILDSPWCDSTRVLVQSACQARKVLYVYRCLNHINVYIQVTTLDYIGLCLGGKSLFMPFLGLIHPSSRKKLEPTHQASKHYSPATTFIIYKNLPQVSPRQYYC